MNPSSSNSSPSCPTLRVRLTNLLATSAKPLPGLDQTSSGFSEGRSFWNVPLLKVFGVTEAGQRACVNIHGAFPYIYVEYPTDRSMEPKKVKDYISRLGSALNYALAKSIDGGQPTKQQARFSSANIIQSIILVKGTPFYGFHVGHSYFLRIAYTKSSSRQLIIKVLAEGAIFGRKWEIFEGHLNFELQFLCDFGLGGCGWLEIDEVRFREPLPEKSDDPIEAHTPSYLRTWTSATTPPNLLHPWPPPAKSTRKATLELDIHVSSILNRHTIRPRDLHHDFVELRHGLVSERKLLDSLEELWEDERRRRREAGKVGSKGMEGLSYGDREGAANGLPGKGVGWNSEERWWEEVRIRIKQDRDALEDQGIRKRFEFEDLLMKASETKERRDEREEWDKYIPTTFAALVRGWPSEPFPSREPQPSSSSAFQPPPPTPYDETPSLESSFENPFVELDSFEHYPSSQPKDDVDLEVVMVASQAVFDTEREEKTKVSMDPWPVTTIKEEALEEEEEDELLLSLDEDFAFNGEYYGTQMGETTSLDQPKEPPTHSFSSLSPEALGPEYVGPQAASSAGKPASSQLASAPKTPSRLRTVNLPSAFNESPLLADDSFVNASIDEDDFELNSLPTPLARNPTLSSSRSWTPTLVSKPTLSSAISPVDFTPSGTLSVKNRSSIQLPPSLADFRPAKRSRYQLEPSSLAGTSTSSVQSRTSDGNLNHSLQLPSLSSQPSSSLPPSLDASLPPALVVESDISYQDPYFSNPVDVPKFPREYAGRLWTFNINGKAIAPETLRSQEVFDGIQDEREVGGDRVYRWQAECDVCYRFRRPASLEVGSMELGHVAPSRKEVRKWLKAQVREKENRRKKVFASQIEGPTQTNTQGFKFSQINQASQSREKRFMSVMSLEVLPAIREGHLPDAKEDEILAVFYCLQSDGQAPDNCYIPGCHIGLIIVAPEDPSSGQTPPSTNARCHSGFQQIHPVFASSELDLMNLLIDLVEKWDPDILSGWEVQGSSWGYVSKRMGLYGGEQFFLAELSPLKETDGQNIALEYNADHTSAFQVQGRHVFNLWRMLRGELNLNQYTFENVAFHLLHRRVPKFAPHTLHQLFISTIPSQSLRCINYFLLRAIMVIEMLDLSELVSRNAEFARVYGVDFADVYQRGSQFKVESFMFRIAKPESLLLRTPSREQVGQQAGAECIPMVMEPQSAFYKDPVVVLDFQSLYPSIMLAYNICYSTCLGRADRLKDKDGNPTDRFGFTHLELAPGTLELLEEYITISPNGMIFVKPTVRKSLLAKMLGEILDTRVMIKDAMKAHKTNKGLMRTLNSRQLALKLLANVTYGYTSASFSGRMPHIQMADAIVQYGRESLEKAIALIHSTPKWGAQVVYGDTDSLFIHLPGKSKEMAFQIGYEMAEAITAKNPKPMKLKFEKVYLPCVLQSKKRYVGFKYEHPDELVPAFDDKGIETVRRDGVPAQQKELEECIKLFFRDPDLSKVKEYCYRQWTRILQGRISIQDFTFAKEVRLGTYSEKSRPPHVIVAAMRADQDAADEPQYGERVPYIIVQGEPGDPQYMRARRPEDALEQEGLRLDGEYYIKKMLIPPLSRIFNLVGANVELWYQTMPRPRWLEPAPFGLLPDRTEKYKKNKLKLTDHFKSDLCYLCKAETHLVPAVCKTCRSNPSSTIYLLQTHQQKAEARFSTVQLICASCSSSPASEATKCISLDCAVLYERVKLKKRVDGLAGLGKFVSGLEEERGRGVVDLTF